MMRYSEIRTRHPGIWDVKDGSCWLWSRSLGSCGGWRSPRYYSEDTSYALEIVAGDLDEFRKR